MRTTLRIVCRPATATALVPLLESRADGGHVTHHAAAGTSRWDTVGATLDLDEDDLDQLLGMVAMVAGSADAEVTVVPADDHGRVRFVDGRPHRDPGQASVGVSATSAAFQRLVAVNHRYVLLMVSAAVIATAGMVGDLPVAIVGAMAFSPDLGRLNAMAFASIERRPRLLLRAGGSLAVGMALAIATAAAAMLLLSTQKSGNPLDAIDPRLVEFVTTLGGGTLTVAIAAGVAAMVVFISDHGRAAVGVGVSITTLPAAAYTGIALSAGDMQAAADAMRVLVVNVICVVGAGVVTGLVLRRQLRRRATPVVADE